MCERIAWTLTLLGGVSGAACNSTASPPTAQETTPTPATKADASPGSPSPAAASSDAGAGDAASADSEGGTGNDGAQFDAPSDASEGDSAGPLAADSSSPPGPPVCDPMHVWNLAALIASVPQTGFARFGGISADETAIAWTSSAGAIYVADRQLRSQPFSSMPSIIDTTSTPVANDRVALGSSGVELFAVSADRKGFVAFYRANVGGAWAPQAALQFSNVEAMASADGSGQFFEPVLGADGKSFFYLLAPASGLPVLYESDWDASAHAWTTGVAPANPELASTSAMARQVPTGGSSDGRTLFFYDERARVERAAWRDSRSSPFITFVDALGMMEAAPNRGCDTLYFQAGVPDSSASTGVAIAQ